MSRYNQDSDLISWIQFRSGYDQKTKNRLMSQVEKRMAKYEDLELSGKNTGYYND